MSTSDTVKKIMDDAVNSLPASDGKIEPPLYAFAPFDFNGTWKLGAIPYRGAVYYETELTEEVCGMINTLYGCSRGLMILYLEALYSQNWDMVDSAMGAFNTNFAEIVFLNPLPDSPNTLRAVVYGWPDIIDLKSVALSGRVTADTLNIACGFNQQNVDDLIMLQRKGWPPVSIGPASIN